MNLRRLTLPILILGSLALAGCTSTGAVYEPGSTTSGSSSGSATVIIHSGYYGRGWGYPGYSPGRPMGPPMYGPWL